MAYADAIRSSIATMDDIADLIEGIFVSGYPATFSTWVPTYGAGGSMTFTSVSTTFARYIRVGKIIILNIYALGTTGGSASGTLTATLPVTAAAAFIGGGGWCTDAGASSLGAQVYCGTTSVLTVARYDGANFTLGAGRGFSVGLVYEAA